jgi:hypothetical protein
MKCRLCTVVAGILAVTAAGGCTTTAADVIQTGRPRARLPDPLGAGRDHPRLVLGFELRRPKGAYQVHPARHPALRRRGTSRRVWCGP